MVMASTGSALPTTTNQKNIYPTEPAAMSSPVLVDPTAAPGESEFSVYSAADGLTQDCETHPIPTRARESISTGALVFAAAGTQVLLQLNSDAEVFAITLQPNAAVALQLSEGNVASFISGNWTLAAGQFWEWGGKYVNNSILLTASAPVTVQFECRYRL